MQLQQRYELQKRAEGAKIRETRAKMMETRLNGKNE